MKNIRVFLGIVISMMLIGCGSSYQADNALDKETEAAVQKEMQEIEKAKKAAKEKIKKEKNDDKTERISDDQNGSIESIAGESSLDKNSNNDADIELLISASEEILKKGFEDHYTISREDDVIVINLWKEGVSQGAVSVKYGLIDKKEWDNMITGLQSLAQSIYKVFEPYGIDVNVNVLNDENKNNTLLMFYNGVKVYDAVVD